MAETNRPPLTPWMRLARLLALAFMLFCVLVFSAYIFYYQGYAAHPRDKLTFWEYSPGELDTILGRIGMTIHGWIQLDLIFRVEFVEERHLLAPGGIVVRAPDEYGFAVPHGFGLNPPCRHRQ